MAMQHPRTSIDPAAEPGDAPLDALAATVADAHHFVFAAAPVGMAVIDLTGTVVEANAALARIMAVERDQLVGRPVLDLVQPEHRVGAERWLHRCLGGEPRPVHVESWFQAEGAERAYVAVDGHPVLAEDGTVTCLVLSVADATADRRLSAALAAAHHDLATLVDRTPVAICRIDAAGRVVLWNPAAEALFGWSAAEVVGAPPPIVPPEAAATFLQVRDAARGGEHAQGVPATCVHRDGHAIRVKVWTSAMDSEEGESPDLVGLLVDVTEEHATEAALRTSEVRWRTLLQNVADTVTVVDGRGVVVAATGELKTILGYPTETWVGRSLTDLLHPDDLVSLQPVIDRVRAEPGTEVTAEARVRHADGSWVDLWVNAVNLLDDPAVNGVVITTRNVSDRKRAERLVTNQAAILEMIARDADLDDVLDAIAAMVEDHDEGAQAAVLLLEGGHLRARARAGRGPGRAIRAALAEVEITTEMQQLLSREHGEPVVIADAETDERAAHLRAHLRAEGLGSYWWAAVCSQDSTLPVGAVIAFHPGRLELGAEARRAADAACTLTAIALDRHTTLAALAHRALHDDLTGLPNRTLLVDRLQIALDRAGPSGEDVSVLYVDVDRFKMVNDSDGHAAGDDVLRAVADRIRRVTRPGDTVARVGADEFVLVCDHPGDLAAVLAVADRLTETLREPFTIGSGDVVLTASMGVALAHPGDDAPALLRNADAAMYRAKQRGRNRLEMYDSAMQASAHDRLTMGADLRRALARHELRVVYQPIVALGSGDIVGAEALLRWRHPVRGDVPPAAFIPVAEETGIIIEIGAWVLETALSEMAGVVAQRAEPFTLSVNLSPRQLDDPHLVTRVAGALRAHRWPPEQLCLELTETALTDDLDTALRVLVRLRATGTRIAVDDFGTGYSSLTHLQRLPLDAIKIDRSFVRGLGEAGGTDRATIATAVLGIAKAMGLAAVAEGVETHAELAVLRQLGCELGQGYLFSVPVPIDALSTLARSNVHRPHPPP